MNSGTFIPTNPATNKYIAMVGGIAQPLPGSLLEPNKTPFEIIVGDPYQAGNVGDDPDRPTHMYNVGVVYPDGATLPHVPISVCLIQYRNTVGIKKDMKAPGNRKWHTVYGANYVAMGFLRANISSLHSMVTERVSGTTGKVEVDLPTVVDADGDIQWFNVQLAKRGVQVEYLDNASGTIKFMSLEKVLLSMGEHLLGSCTLQLRVSYHETMPQYRLKFHLSGFSFEKSSSAKMGPGLDATKTSNVRLGAGRLDSSKFKAGPSAQPKVSAHVPGSTAPASIPAADVTKAMGGAASTSTPKKPSPPPAKTATGSVKKIKVTKVRRSAASTPVKGGPSSATKTAVVLPEDVEEEEKGKKATPAGKTKGTRAASDNIPAMQKLQIDDAPEEGEGEEIEVEAGVEAGEYQGEHEASGDGDVSGEDEDYIVVAAE